MQAKLFTASIVMGVAMLTGCAGRAYVVAGGPPPPRYGVVGYAPGPGFVWTEGYYDLRGSNWVWVQGRWQRPGRPGRAWVAPEWRHEGRNWRFHRGYWR